MEIIASKEALRSWIGTRAARGRVLVPTMGALHRGHTSLFDLARTFADESGAEVVATIFVNPVQFGPNEDFDAYPRPLETDLELCAAHGVDAVFTPDVAAMYEEDRSILVTESRLSDSLCGASRPGHFDGVCTVVAKLFNLVQPDSAVFGEKDYQQLAVIRRMVRDLDFPVKIVGVPTVREPDGLALSSRNAYLSAAERAEAPVLNHALTETAEGIDSGFLETVEKAEEFFLSRFALATLGRLDYFSIVDADTLAPLRGFGSHPPRLIAAAWFGKTRLIDNVGLPAAANP